MLFVSIKDERDVLLSSFLMMRRYDGIPDRVGLRLINHSGDYSKYSSKNSSCYTGETDRISVAWNNKKETCIG